MNVVAEGVETEEQLELLRKIGCDQVQGYLMAHPVLADEVPAMLQRIEERMVPQKGRVYAHS
jgi:EAL domain-containing protein (putative c-di-GMP-specific phosphodiesterase class I)